MIALPKLATAMNRSGNPDVLRTITMTGVAVAVWTPDPPDGFQEWIETCRPTGCPAFAPG